jgi:hypothetical protein
LSREFVLNSPPHPVRWQIDPVRHECSHVTLLARLDEENRSFQDFHVLPEMDRLKRFHIRLTDPWLSRGLPLNDLSVFCTLVACICADKKD